MSGVDEFARRANGVGAGLRPHLDRLGQGEEPAVVVGGVLAALTDWARDRGCLHLVEEVLGYGPEHGAEPPAALHAKTVTQGRA